MNNPLSQRVQRIKPSPTLAVSAKASQLKAAGHDIINLGVGEPDFDTPVHIKEAAIKAIQDGFTKYTAVDGIPSLKKAIIDKMHHDHQLSYQPKQILVSCGCKQSFYNFAQAFLNQGDEVIIPAPYWVSYPDMVILADATPVFVNTDIQQHFKISAADLEAAITPRTRLLVLNSPSNPSGMAYTKQELAALGEVLRKHPNIWIISDDMYERILWSPEPFANILNACPDLANRTVVLNGVSKAYAMTGWRIGYAAGPEEIITAMTNIQSQSTSNPTSISQIAAQVALTGDQHCVNEMKTSFKQRHDFVYESLKTMPGIKCHPSDGTFYSFPQVADAMQKMGIATDIEFAELLLKAGLAIVPGSAFGAPGCIRISFAASMEMLQKAMERLRQVVSNS